MVQRRGTLLTNAFNEPVMPSGFDAAAQKGRAMRNKSLKHKQSIQLKDMAEQDDEESAF